MSSSSKSTATHDLRILPNDKTKDVYHLPGHCTNCGWAGQLLIPKGVDAPRHGIGSRKSPAWCPRCGCRELVANL